MNISAFKEWQTGAKWQEEEVSFTVKNPTGDFEEDSLIFLLFANLNLTVSDYVSGVVWYFEELMNILSICVIYLAFRVFASDRC